MEKDNSSSAKTPRPQVQNAETKAAEPDMIGAALRGSITWHEEQGRPYSASVDRDALAEIERLRIAYGDLAARQSALHAELRQHVIFRPFGRGEEGTCIACDGEWKDGAEVHKPGCLAEAKP